MSASTPNTPTTTPLDVAEFRLQPGTTLIEASAGTGKTYTIQYIVLDLLLQGLTLQEILVVTFTEAATKELVGRLQQFLTQVNAVLAGEVDADKGLRQVLDRAIQERDEPTVTRLLQNAMLEIDEAPIFTIHGFSHRALQENAFAANANYDAELCSDTRPILEELVADFLRKLNLELPSTPPTPLKQEDLLNRAAKLTPLLRVKEPSPHDLASLGQSLADAASGISVFSNTQDAILKELMSFHGKLKKTSYKDTFFENLPQCLNRLFADPNSLSAKELEALSHTKLKNSLSKDFKGIEFASGLYTAIERFAETRNGFHSDLLHYFDTWMIQAFCRAKEERGIMTYNDMILDLDRALQKSDVLKNQLQTRYRAALVDEFQDTDDRQYRIFQTLFGKGIETGHFFAMIGDPKQSIYSFRGADIAAYLKAREESHYRYTLPMNFRSEAKLVEGTNAFFKGTDLGRAIGGDARDSIAFDSVKAADIVKRRLVFAEAAYAERFYERALPYPMDDKPNTAQQSATGIMAEDIARLLEYSAKGLVFFESPKAEGSGTLRQPIHPGDIAVLVDSHREAEDVQAALQQAGILAVRGKAGNIRHTTEAQEYLTFLLACLKPQELLINRLLVSPLFQKNEAALNRMTDADRREIYEQFTLLGSRWREGTSVGVLWAEFTEATHLRERLLAEIGGERALTNYLHIGEFAQELERLESLSPERLTDRLLELIRDDSKDGAGEEHLVRLESDGRAVKITTMHGSKGLEYPIVFLPSLWQKCVRSAAKKDELLRLDPEDSDALDCFEKSPDEVVARLSAEALRLGYVALTRAVHFCVYYNVRNLPAKKTRGNHSDGWFDTWLLKQRGGDYPNAAVEAEFLSKLEHLEPVALSEEAPESAPEARNLEHDISNAYRITSYSALTRYEKLESHDNDPSVPGGFGDEIIENLKSAPKPVEIQLPSDLLLDALPGGVRTGTCVHEILERCDFSDSTYWRRTIQSILERHFPDSSPSRLEERINQVEALLENLTQGVFAGPDGLEVSLADLKPRACIHELEFYFPVQHIDLSRLEGVVSKWAVRVGLSYQESPYGTREIEGFLTGSVDLFFTQGGRYMILDWKTNRPLKHHQPIRASYNRQGMHEHMEHGSYYLQALIYSVATTAYLKERLKDKFDFAKHIGGFIYCFVRGLGPDTGWLHDAFSEAEVLEASEALGQTRSTGEAAL